MKRLINSHGYRDGLIQALKNIRPVEDDSTKEMQHAISKWLGELAELNGVPFHYLVPDVRMLPEESIRFFQIDPSWVDALVDGAFSLGRATTDDVSIDRSLLPDVKRLIGKTAGRRRAVKFGKEHLRENSVTQMSGFLLRSAVVSGWPGLEVDAYPSAVDQSATPLNILRFDHIANDLLLCIFDGLISEVRLFEPTEILHFGFEQPDNVGDSYKKLLRYVDDPGGTNKPGSQLPVLPQNAVSATFRDVNTRVIDVNALAMGAAGIQATLVLQHGMSLGHPFTAAEFALEMVQGVEEVNFIVNLPTMSTNAHN